jgi:nucleoside-diphosphate-sugar epimerase
MQDSAILLGLGFTTRRLARRLLARGLNVHAEVRDPGRFRELAALGVRLGPPFPRDALLIHTVPPLPQPENQGIRDRIAELAPRRVVYISSTGVYGEQTLVNESTPVSAVGEKAIRRIEEETWLGAGPWETLIIRPAAIYGPSRGIHVRVQEGRMPRSESGGVVSRIHVDDLAAVLEAGAISGLAGAWPLADERPCSSPEIALWCCRLLNKEISAPWKLDLTVAGRSVDGGAVLRELGLSLIYPDYESGILASIAEAHAVAERAAATFGGI